MRVGVVSRRHEFNNLYAIARNYPEYMESTEALPTGSVYMVVMHVRRAEMFVPVCV